MSLLKACADCGALTDRPRCLDCKPEVSAHRRGYTSTWKRLSQRARRLSPFCEDCGTTEDLTVDHSTEAWERHEAGREIPLDLLAVVCRSCNGKRGRARPTPVDPPRVQAETPSKAKFQSHTASLPSAVGLPVGRDLAEDLDWPDVGLHLVSHHDHLGDHDHLVERRHHLVVRDVGAKDGPEEVLVDADVQGSAQMSCHECDAAFDTSVQGIVSHESSLP